MSHHCEYNIYVILFWALCIAAVNSKLNVSLCREKKGGGISEFHMPLPHHSVTFVYIVGHWETWETFDEDIEAGYEDIVEFWLAQ